MLLTTKEIALKWGVSATWVTTLCKKGRVEGAVREANRWYIPEETKKPKDKRSCKNIPAKARFRFVDLFAGIGGFHQAMRYLGGECIMAAEINEECRKTYYLNYRTKEKKIREDVRKINLKPIEPFDVLCAGFPCQPFSKAGAQKGFQDKTRGNLFYTIMDILDLHPEVKFIILENVRNLADKTENWDVITSELAKRNFYITEKPIILSPSDFGIPQIRERVYILGIRKDICNKKIQNNGFIQKGDLELERHFKKCKMGDAWTILENNVDDSYIISAEQERMILAWDEFRVGTGIKVIKSRITGATQLTQVIDKLSVASEIVCKPIFSGIFSFEGYDGILNRNVNQQMRSTLIRSNGKVNHLCIGKNCFIKYWPEYAPKQENVKAHYSFYEINDLSFGYFISNMVEDVYMATVGANLPETLTSMFYPIEDTKEVHKLTEISLEI